MIRRFPETSHLHRQKRFNPINYPHSKPAAAPQLDIRGKNKAGKLKKLEGNKAGKLQKMEGNKVAKVAGQKLDRGKSVVAPAPKISLSCLARYGSCLDIQVKTNWGSNNGSRIISMDKAIFRYEYEELLEKEHIYELLNHKELSATVISLYIRFLYKKLVCTRRLSNRFSFLSPHKLSMYKLDPMNVKKYVVDILLGNREKDKLFLAPYNSGYIIIYSLFISFLIYEILIY
ncbi:uncharacterized protein [Cicer arietinum]|uniref:uncharacterized protein isoform X2 n=1 Tax=Cicer arietinum TaxID=3827 RepID=UPI003CC5453C